MASGWPWRWSRWTDSPKEKQLQPEGYEMEERLLALLAGVHQQVVADAQHSEQLATLSRRRSDVRMSTLEDGGMRLNDLSLGLKSLEQAAGLAGERAWQDLTQTVEQQQEALRREEELQHHVIQRLKPLDARLNALEAQLFLDWPPQKVQVVEALDSETSFRSCPSREDASLARWTMDPKWSEGTTYLPTETGRPPREQTGRTSALVVPKLDLCPELAQLTQALQHFGSAIRQAEERLETPQSREVL
eukprot:g17741.t1